MEQGTHQELLELEGYYYKLYTLGFAEGNEDEVRWRGTSKEPASATPNSSLRGGLRPPLRRARIDLWRQAPRGP